MQRLLDLLLANPDDLGLGFRVLRVASGEVCSVLNVQALDGAHSANLVSVANHCSASGVLPYDMLIDTSRESICPVCDPELRQWWSAERIVCGYNGNANMI